MQHKEKKLGRFLLVTYLLVAFNCSFSHGHLGLFDDSCESSHCHEDFGTVHHSYDFHIGIFHYLGHILEELRHIDNDDFGEDHLVFNSSSTSKRSTDLNKTTVFYFNENGFLLKQVDASSPTSPPKYFRSLTQVSLKSNIPLRAPPALI